MENSILNPDIVILSIIILLFVCSMLIALVFALSTAYRRLQAKSQDKIFKVNNDYKHHLTGLGNRVSLINTLDSLFESDTKNEINIALLFIDLDDFNNINSSIGPKLGDALLQHVASKIASEAAMFTKYVYHIGSDEFAVILYDSILDIDAIASMTKDLINIISQPVKIDGYDLQISCCIGICVYPECATNPEELLKHAGSARDNAKHIGYGSYSFYTKDMSKASVLRSLISADLRYALERNELSVHYQPKININSGLVCGAEALLRWHHPSLGNITPNIFIPVMEDLGLIHPVGKWVFNTACKDMSRLHKDGFDYLSIAVNVSPQQFNKGDIASIIAEAIWQSGITPYKVELELTEALVMKDTEKSLLMLKVVQSMGVKIAVDDFGTGYSSMNHLTRFPISVLKIDQSFIHDMHLSPVKFAIVSAIIRMAKQLNFEIVAEGVECIEEHQLLEKEGCDLIQGFYYSKALPFAEFVNFVHARNKAGNKQIDTQEKSA